MCRRRRPVRPYELARGLGKQDERSSLRSVSEPEAASFLNKDHNINRNGVCLSCLPSGDVRSFQNTVMLVLEKPR